ncbi:HigA family addiction module antitoxin [Bradyrhizobium canariense]|uniref:Addiction module antidote protein, HigA family n=1 Tax=Bradyrhizobium canariense TaxID=255045 RepID=A0A1X3FTD5_9BRAD|nr:HigA family addiction module antitoxin [Bradyrhizobium canariense]OSI69915.1 addiction module antidote protein, HigA family [Bradyrhizobium canariense]OSI74941.1 addiction module antidote protein, HigA family [Bradyrhizobium canariense]OSI83437.1 addiction module antidote protein, HigA family [Bradyrhizobium canariense]OSI86584.1 addiction module antidote protein, HigA family [Bradyrhizobium canariense]OSI98457.1 addiction module antidote protein, HigA family [Bradyrhizobium canariense]
MTIRAPAEVFPPGEFLADELEARGWTQTEFAEIIGRPQKLVNDIVNAKRAVTPETAADFAAAFGTSAQFWMNLETAWQLSKVPARDDSIARAAKLRERFPVREMVKRGWIPSGDLVEIERSVLSFFSIPSIDAPIEFQHAARRNYQKEVSAHQWAWILRVKQLATALKTPAFSGATLRAKIPDLERLMAEPEEIRHVPRVLMECGVRFVVVEPIPASEIQGVCLWINENRSPVIGLTLKGDQIDKFWFDLWHEIEHVLNGDGKDHPVIDNFEEPASELEDESENVANRSAANHCVPLGAMKDFILRHDPMFSEKNLLGFARIVKRHPGIVAGQLQRHTRRWELFKKLQPRIRHILTQTALTDGYGVNP